MAQFKASLRPTHVNTSGQEIPDSAYVSNASCPYSITPTTNRTGLLNYSNMHVPGRQDNSTWNRWVAPPQPGAGWGRCSTAPWRRPAAAACSAALEGKVCGMRPPTTTSAYGGRRFFWVAQYAVGQGMYVVPEFHFEQPTLQVGVAPAGRAAPPGCHAAQACPLARQMAQPSCR
jgi:hypothetical protein